MMKLLHIAPFVRLFLFFFAGVVVQSCCNFVPFVPYLILLGILLMAISDLSCFLKCYNLRFLFGLGLFFLLFSLGVFLFHVSDQNINCKTPDNIGLYEVQLINDPVRKSKTYKCEMRILNTELENQHFFNQKIILYLSVDDLSSSLAIGDCLFVYTQLENTLSYWQKKYFVATGFVKTECWMKIEDGYQPLSIPLTALLVRRSFLDQLQDIIPNRHHYSIASALMFGYKQDMDQDLRQSFSRIGAGHILAVSGLHFSILFGIISFFLSFIGNSFWGRMLQFFIILPFVWSFALLVGLSPSVIRAAWMLSILSIGKVFFLKAFSFNTLALTAFFMLLLNPFYFYDIGFQLSFIAVMAILLFNPYLNNLYKSRNKIISYFWNLITISTSAQIGIFPLSIYYFNQFPVVFLFTNIGIIPIVTILLFLIPVTLLLNNFGELPIMAWPLNQVLDYMLSFISSLDKLPFQSVECWDLSGLDLFLIYIFIFFFFCMLIKKRIVYLYILLIIVLFKLIYYLC